MNPNDPVPRPRRRSRRNLAILLGALAVIAMVGIISELSGNLEQRRRIARMETDLRAMRDTAESCAARLTEEESSFRAFGASVDSLRAAVRRYEAATPGGVAATDYKAYLESFEAYNSAVPVWQERADSLRVRWARCRDVTAHHNALIDSLRTAVADPDS